MPNVGSPSGRFQTLTTAAGIGQIDGSAQSTSGLDGDFRSGVGSEGAGLALHGA